MFTFQNLNYCQFHSPLFISRMIIVLFFSPRQSMFTLLSILRRDALFLLPDAVEEAVVALAIWDDEAVVPVSVLSSSCRIDIFVMMAVIILPKVVARPLNFLSFLQYPAASLIPEMEVVCEVTSDSGFCPSFVVKVVTSTTTLAQESSARFCLPLPLVRFFTLSLTVFALLLFLFSIFRLFRMVALFLLHVWMLGPTSRSDFLHSTKTFVQFFLTWVTLFAQSLIVMLLPVFFLVIQACTAAYFALVSASPNAVHKSVLLALVSIFFLYSLTFVAQA